MDLNFRGVVTLCLLAILASSASAQDTDSSLSASATLTEPGTISSVSAGFIDVLDFTITDTATADAFPTEVTQVVIDVSGTATAANHAWRLNGAGVVNAVGVVGAGTITFSSLTLSVANGTSAVCTLSLDLATTPAGTPDNSTFLLSLDSTDFTVSGATSSNFSGATTGPVNNGGGLVYQVVATKLRMVSQPSASQSVGTAFGFSVDYTDAGDNRDLDITDQITATRSDAGAITSGATATASSGLAIFTVNCGMPGNLSLSLNLTDLAAGGVDLSASPIATTSFALVAANDANSTVSAGPASEPASISSVAGANVDVFDFNINDAGTSDGKATVITQIVISTGGSGTPSDHTWRLNGPDASNVLGTVGAGTITFTGLSISVANGGSQTYSLRLTLAATPASTQDNQNFTFSISSGGFTLGASSTSFGASGPITNGGGMAYAVAATKVRVFAQPGATQAVGTPFGCSVEYTDANNNRDRDITDSIDALRTDAGAISGGGTTSAVLGLATFSITCGMPGKLALTLQFRDQTGGTVNFFASPVTSTGFNLVAADDADSTITEGAAAGATLASSAGLTGVFNLTMTDLGTSDAKATILTDITYNITVSGGSDDALDFNWQLFNGSTTFSPSGTTATTVSFSSATLISVANSGSGTLTLRAQVNSASATIDNKTLGVNVTSAGITTSASGTSLATSQSVTKAATTTVTVTATQIQIVQQPGASESVGVSFQVTVQYADAQGNRDLNATDTMSVARNDAGIITLPSPANGVAVAGLATFNMTLGLPGSLSGSLRLTFTDLSSGAFNFSGSPKNTNTFLLTANNDANSTIAESPASPATLSSAASLSAVFSVLIADLGTSDGLPTSVNGVTYTVTVSGGSDSTAQFNWQLFNGVSAFAPSGTTATTVSFSATPLISVANGGSGTLTLRAQVTGASATLDNKTLDIQVTTSSFTIAGGSTSLAASQTVNNATNTQVQVVATQLRFVGAPPTSATVNSTIAVSVEYADALGNRDLNASGGPENVSVTWTGGGAVTNGSMGPASGLCNFGANNLRLQAPGALGGTLTFTDSAPGLSVGSVNISPFDLTDLNDANSQVQAGPLSEPASVSSLAAGFTNVFDFRLRDFGTSDGLPTLVTQIVINVSGTANASEHSWRLNGPAVSNASGVATTSTITFSGLSINVPNGGSQDFTLSLQLATSPTLTLDNSSFLLALANTGISTGGASTTFTASSTNNGAGLNYTVLATRLTVKTQPGASQIVGVDFDVVVAYTDINGNTDTNVTDTIITMTRSDAGSVQAPVLPIAAVNGVVSLTGASQVRLGLPAAAILSLTFTDNAGGTLASANVTTTNFSLGDNTPPTVTGAQLLLGADPRGRTIRVSFSEPVRAVTALVLTNYTLSFGGLHPSSITQPTTSQADLVLPDYAVASLDTLAIANVQDVSNNPMVAVAAQPITSGDVLAPTLVSISFNDSDGSGTPTTGDQYLFLFSEAVNDRIFSGASSADSALSPASLSYGTPNSVSFGDDQGLATDSRLVLVTLVSGLTITGNEAIALAGITDLSGNTAATTAQTLTVVDNISPRLVLTRLDDRDNNGNASPGDALHVYFSEAINAATMPLVNTAGELDAALAISGGGTFGPDATALFVVGNKELRITLGSGSATAVGKTLNPPATVTDPAGNPDATSPAVAVAAGTSDIFAPGFTLVYSAANPNAVPVGTLTITATFTDTQPIIPTVAINQPGINDLPATNMVSVGGSTRIWRFDWTVSFADGTVNIDGINVVTIVGRPTDLRGNALVPASNNTFKTDTTNPLFATVVVSDPDNHYRSGDTISLLATLNETGLSVTANLSVVDSALGTLVPFVDNGNGTYSLTSTALSSGTLIQGSNIPIVVRARDAALNTSTTPVLVNVDDTAPTAALLYDQPSSAVGAGNLTITLSLSEPSPTVPSIAISGLSGTPNVAATPMTGNAGQSTYTFVLNVINPTTGTATVVVSNVSDLAQNPPASVANASFTVNTTITPLIANAGPDQTISLPQQVQLDASASTGLNRTYSWTQDSGPGVTLTSATTATPRFFAQVAASYVFRVTVTSGSNSADDTVTVNLVNSLPVVEAGATLTLDRNDVVAGDTAVGLFGSALDANGDALFITWSLVSSPASGNLVIASPAQLTTALNVLGASIVPGVYRFQLTVFDPIGLGASTPSTDSVDVIVIAPGVLPPYANAGPDLTAIVGQSVSLSSLGSGDGDGSVVAWQWRPIARPVGSTALPTGAASSAASFTADKAGVYEFGLRVIDDDNLVSSEALVRVVAHDLRAATFNRVPRAAASLSFADTDSNTFINVGETATLSGTATDADGDAVTLNWRQLAGPQVLIIPDPHAATLAVAPTSAGTYVLRLDVVDAKNGGGLCAEVSFVVAAASASAPRALASLAAADDANNDAHVLFIPGVGVDNSALNTSIDLDGGASSGASLAFVWRQISGPTVAIAGHTTSAASIIPVMPGVYVFELSVTDSAGLTSTQLLTFGVETYDATANPSGKAVARANAGADLATSGGIATLIGSATDADTASLALKFHWVQTGGAPVVLDVSTPDQPRFTPPRAGTYVFALFVSDGATYSLADTVTVLDTRSGGGGGGDNGGNSCTAAEGKSLLLLALLAGMAIWIRRRRVLA
jgi:hypothetical protein